MRRSGLGHGAPVRAPYGRTGLCAAPSQGQQVQTHQTKRCWLRNEIDIGFHTNFDRAAYDAMKK